MNNFPGHEEHNISTLIDDVTLSCGYGDLDEYGAWEFPCYDCARELEKRYKEKYGETIECWPWKKEGEKR